MHDKPLPENRNSAAPRLRRLASNALLNLAGHAAPLLAAVVAIPYLAMTLGAERFGLLSLAWVLVGYFNLFDLGLGRALTRAVAELSGTPRETELPALIRNALAAMAALGAAAGIALFALAPWLCTAGLHVPDGLRGDAIGALKVLAACIPFVIVTAGLRGLLEARQSFGWINAIRVPLGLLTFLGPMAAASVSPDILPIAAVLAALRVAAAIAHAWPCVLLYPGVFAGRQPGAGRIGSLFAFGAWLTVSNVVGPLMVYVDRFIIGATLALSAVAYYSAPFEIVTRLWLIPAALTAVIFPALTAHLAAEPQRALHVYGWGLKFVFLAVYPLTLFLASLAPDWLGLWLGAEYAKEGANAARLLALGVLINCLAYIPFTVLQAAGRADLTAKLHLTELPLYFAVLLWLVNGYGITGAALAWSLRCGVDAIILFAMAARRLPGASALFSAGQLAAVAVLIGLLGISAAAPGMALRLALFACAFLVFLALGWRVLLSPDEREMLSHPRRFSSDLDN